MKQIQLIRVLATVATLGVLASVILPGCAQRQGPGITYDIKGAYTLPPEMSDCSVFKLETNENIPNLFVVRCPNSTTSTNWVEKQGKSDVQRSTIVVDGVEYVPAPKPVETISPTVQKPINP